MTHPIPTDDLVKRLRNNPQWIGYTNHAAEAADRIEAQAAEIARLSAERDALESICAEAYQAVGVLADKLGFWHDGALSEADASSINGLLTLLANAANDASPPPKGSILPFALTCDPQAERDALHAKLQDWALQALADLGQSADLQIQAAEREAAAFRAGAEAMRSRVSNWHATQSRQFRKPQQHGTLTEADITRIKWAAASHGAHAVAVGRMPIPAHQSSTQTGTKPT